MVVGSIGSLKLAVMAVVVTNTPVAFASGLTAVTTGGVTTPMAPGARIGSRSAPHPASKALDRMAASHTKRLVHLLDWRTISPSGLVRSKTAKLLGQCRRRTR